MVRPSNSIQRLNDALGVAHARLAESSLVTVVIGSQAADLDSMASSIAYAYLLSSTTPADSGRAVVPVMNIRRDEFALRTEAVYLFREVGVDVSRLCFLDDVDLDVLAECKRLDLVLVDHNRLAGSQQALAERVTEIIDHHEDEGLYPVASSRAIEPGLGSTATLVAERILRSCPRILDEGLATLLIGTILLDTANLRPERSRAKDRVVVSKLSTFASVAQESMYERLRSEKFNPAGLSTFDLLRKDYKQWQVGDVKYGISSVPQSIRCWTHNDDAMVEGFLGYAKGLGLDLLLVMHFFESPEFRRELTVCGPDPHLVERTVSALIETDLDLEPIALDGDHGAGGGIRAFAQRNAACSRKKLSPFLQRVFRADST